MNSKNDASSVYLQDQDNMNLLEAIISQRLYIETKHYSMNEFVNAYVISVDNTGIKIKFFEEFSELDFLPGDSIEINFEYSSNFYIMKGKIDNIHNLYPLEISIIITSINKQSLFRKAKRFFVSLPAEIDLKSKNEKAYAIIKNISQTGLKLSSKANLSLHDSIDITIFADKYYKINCTCNIVRKNIIENYYEYGTKIQDFSPKDQIVFNELIKTLKTKGFLF